MKTLLSSFAALTLVLGGCAYELSPYTSATQQQTQLDASQLQKVQFYLSGDIILYRDYSSAETQIASGEIKIVNGQKVEQVVIKSGTPGVIVGVNPDNTFLVSFESDGSFLRFGANNDYGGKYTLMAKSWQGRSGVVDYAGREFKSTPESIYAFLEVNMQKINNTTIDTKQAGGRTIGN